MIKGSITDECFMPTNLKKHNGDGASFVAAAQIYQALCKACFRSLQKGQAFERKTRRDAGYPPDRFVENSQEYDHKDREGYEAELRVGCYVNSLITGLSKVVISR